MDRSPTQVVLVMSDHERRFSVKLALHHAGFEVEEAADLKEGLHLLFEVKPQVLVIERAAAGVDDVMRRLAAVRLELHAARTTVIMLCDSPPSAQDQRMARELGSVSFLLEPVDAEAIVGRARQHSPTARQLTPIPLVLPPHIRVEGRSEPGDSASSAQLGGGFRFPSPPPREFQEERIGRDSPPPRRKRLQATQGLREPSPPPDEGREVRLVRERPVPRCKTPIPSKKAREPSPPPKRPSRSPARKPDQPGPPPKRPSRSPARKPDQPGSPPKRPSRSPARTPDEPSPPSGQHRARGLLQGDDFEDFAATILDEDDAPPRPRSRRGGRGGPDDQES